MRYAVIENGVVVNIVKAEAAFAQDQGWIEAGNAAIGDMYDGAFSKPPGWAAAQAAAEAERARQAAITSAVTGDAELVGLMKATPQGIEDRIDAIFPNPNFTPAQRQFLKRLTKLVVSQLPKQPT